MPVMRSFVVYNFGVAAAIIVLCGVAAIAQQTDAVPTDENEENGENESVEEIIVVAPKPGDRRRVDEVYEDPMRARLLRELYEMEEIEEENEWRQVAAGETSDRIKWGYDPKDDYQKRNEIDLLELPSEKNKPATLFRFEF